LQRDTVRTVRNAYRGQETAISQIKALDQTRVSTRSALEATQAGYEVGTRTIVDVLNAERNVYLAERDYASARYSYIANYLTLRRPPASCRKRM
jgi:outer membrane protein